MTFRGELTVCGSNNRLCTPAFAKPPPRYVQAARALSRKQYVSRRDYSPTMQWKRQPSREENAVENEKNIKGKTLAKPLERDFEVAPVTNKGFYR